VSDIGHTLLDGPIGAGKSVGLLTIAANARAVPGMRIFYFDKGYSAYALTHALGGQHLDLGEEEVPLQPLARVDNPVDRMQTQELLEAWMEVHGVKLLPTQSRALHRALGHVAESTNEHRTITSLITQVQDATVRNGLNAFSLSGPLGRFLDADTDVTFESNFVTFEVEALMAMGPKVRIPVLTYLFHRIDQRLDGRPTLLILDEAWTVLADPAFGSKLEQWLRECRKKNAACVMATQSLSDIKSSTVRDVLLESTKTKLYLPSPGARDPLTRELYVNFGLTALTHDICYRGGAGCLT
jgi:type IV secretion system protein VirB4